MKHHDYENSEPYKKGDSIIKRHSHNAIYERAIKVSGVKIMITQGAPHGQWGIPEVPIYANGLLFGKMSKCIEGNGEWEFDVIIKGDYWEYEYALPKNRRHAFLKACRYIESTAANPDENDVDEWLARVMNNIAEYENSATTAPSNSPAMDYDR